MMNMIGGISNMAMGTIGGIFSSIAGMKWDKQMSKLLEQDPTYTKDPYAEQRYGMAQTLLNSRMPGAAAAERNIYGNSANAYSNIFRGATDASQALALASGIQGQEGQQFDNLQQKEAADYYNKLGMWNDASKGLSDEHTKLFDDEVRRWQDKINIKTAQYKARAGAGQMFSNYGNMVGSSLSSMGGGMGGSGGGGMMSDVRLKHRVVRVGVSPSGVNIYQFSYLGSNNRYEGVLAHEVPHATYDVDGYSAVDYSKIDVQFKQL